MSWWPFRRKYTLEDSGILQEMTDYHSHLLPGVDDGVRTREEAFEILRLYEQLGIREVWFTPHVMEEIPNTTVGLRHCFEEFCNSYTGKIRLYLAAEYMLDNLFKERLANNDLLPLGKDGTHLLIETSYFNPPIDLYNTLEKIKNAGYYPVLAHPERYRYMGEKDYQLLKKYDVMFQSNLPSLVGCYGKHVLHNMHYLLVKGYIDIWGSDTHRLMLWKETITSPCQINKISIANII